MPLLFSVAVKISFNIQNNLIFNSNPFEPYENRKLNQQIQNPTIERRTN
jgi:hypothetical protein